MYCKIIADTTVNKLFGNIFDYEIPDSLDIKVGSRVLAPYGKSNKEIKGFVIEIFENIGEVPYAIKQIIGEVEPKQQILNEEQIAILKFLVEYYGSTYTAALHCVLPTIKKGSKLENLFKIDPSILEACETSAKNNSTTINSAATKNNSATIDSPSAKNNSEAIDSNNSDAIDLNNSEVVDLNNSEAIDLNNPEAVDSNNSEAIDLNNSIAIDTSFIEDDKFITLNEEQENVYRTISDYSGYRTFLMEGVTGSGKTEIFLYLIRDILEKGQSAIVLVPEISLTRQTIKRFKDRFGSSIALTHSKLSAKERTKVYMDARNGNAKVIIGPRSAVFMPLQNLSLIIIDEEHDSSYKSEKAPKFHATEIAKLRMQNNGGKVVLASATPSMESYYKAVMEEYTHLKLLKRAGNAQMPKIEIADMREELASGNLNVISRKLHRAILDTVKADKQVIILLNRRGYSTFVNCRSCGHVLKCNNCDQPFTYHKSGNYLSCHYCLEKQSVPETCPECGSKYVKFFGNGTQKVEEYLTTHFEKYGISRMDLDTVSKKNAMDNLLADFENKKTKILVGTQMVSKGHDFKDVTLVGIISADSLLYSEDFQAGEKTYQLLTQTLGRSGRGLDRGKVVIQTYSPQNYVITSILQNKQHKFYKDELLSRKFMKYPPFHHIFMVIVSSEDEQLLKENIKKLYAYYKHYNRKKLFRILGPVVAMQPKIAKNYRWKITILGADRKLIMMYGQYCIDKFVQNEKPKKCTISWDVDPKNMA